MTRSDPAQRWLIANEFATVSAHLDHSANGVRLCLTDVRSGQRIHLDPMLLESLIWAFAGGKLDEALAPAPDDARWSVLPGAEAEG